MNDEIKEIRDYIACPQLGDDYYGEWGALRLDQRLKIKSLLDCITNLQEENERLNDELKRLHNLLNSQAYQDLDNYKSRIEKAIDYITTEQLYTNYQWGKSQYVKILKDLLNILNGGDE